MIHDPHAELGMRTTSSRVLLVEWDSRVRPKTVKKKKKKRTKSRSRPYNYIIYTYIQRTSVPQFSHDDVQNFIYLSKLRPCNNSGWLWNLVDSVFSDPPLTLFSSTFFFFFIFCCSFAHVIYRCVYI